MKYFILWLQTVTERPAELTLSWVERCYWLTSRVTQRFLLAGDFKIE